LFLIARSLDYKPDWIIRTIEGNWRSAVSKFVSNYLGKNDLKYGKKLTYLRKTMPELFKRD
ncbi:MAG: hypothetical protein HZA10_01200, partial [Nitrospirae bacterium]|nr:hypothetical protein [Nitrospirota bacterium]